MWNLSTESACHQKKLEKIKKMNKLLRDKIKNKTYIKWQTQKKYPIKTLGHLAHFNKKIEFVCVNLILEALSLNKEVYTIRMFASNLKCHSFHLSLPRHKEDK